MFKRTSHLLFATGLVVSLAACSLDSSGEGNEKDQDPDAAITLLSHPTIYAALGGDAMIAAYEEATGISVNVTTADIGPHLDRLLADYQAGTGTYDVVALQNTDYMPRVTSGLLPLNDFIEAADDDWEWEDFIENLRNFSSVDGNQYGVPVRIGTQMLYYRTDLFEDAGLTPPETFDEYVAAAAKLDVGKVHGAVQRGIPRELVDDWMGFFYSAGGELVDDAGQCTLNSDAGIAATDLFVDLVEDDLLPTDLFAWGRDDYISSMQRGEAAMGVFFSPYWGFLVDPEDSSVAENISYALSPVTEGVTPGTSRVLTWNLSITSDSANQAGAWALIEHATSPENSLASGLDHANGPVRTSTYTDPRYVEAYPVAEAWLQSAEVAVADPPMDELLEMYDIIADRVTSAINGSATSSDALDAACGQIDRILN